uniref:Uncharacterized protein n=1 Tax=viral metagenome TaxID=1070528 RepID=A0A6C0KG09_9ZZZZ
MFPFFYKFVRRIVPEIQKKMRNAHLNMAGNTFYYGVGWIQKR